ncbi:MAG: RsmE family RNA methyltransferase [Desulfuromonadales bacterium]|nr:RsmE family RNA methyltransferase [Desulfuromonadales bacterium]
MTDPQETCYRARITVNDDTGAVLIPFFTCPSVASPLVIDVYQAIPDKERFELVLQKLTELGAARIIPFVCQRSLTQEQRDAKQKKSHRWPDVVLRAAKQCRRADLPELWTPLEWRECLQEAVQADLALIFYEGHERSSLRSALQVFSGQRLALIVGPEGGFTDPEIAQARQSGLVPVGLGPRILRTETAAMVGAAVVQYELGDIGIF